MKFFYSKTFSNMQYLQYLFVVGGISGQHAPNAFYFRSFCVKRTFTKNWNYYYFVLSIFMIFPKITQCYIRYFYIELLQTYNKASNSGKIKWFFIFAPKVNKYFQNQTKTNLTSTCQSQLSKHYEHKRDLVTSRKLVQ